MGLKPSPSQCIEALFISKGDVKKMSDPLNQDELVRVEKWFEENRDSVRPILSNYLSQNSAMKSYNKATQQQLKRLRSRPFSLTERHRPSEVSELKQRIK